MSLSQVDRLSALLLARTISNSHASMDFRGELDRNLRRLYSYKVFALSEIAEMSNLSVHQVKQRIRWSKDDEFSPRGGVAVRHLDHLTLMVADKEFAKNNFIALEEDGASRSALARVLGVSHRTLTRWAEEQEENAN